MVERGSIARLAGVPTVYGIEFAGGRGSEPGDNLDKKGETPQEAEWPIPLTDKQKADMRYSHAENALRHLKMLEEHGYDVTEALKEWEEKHGET